MIVSGVKCRRCRQVIWSMTRHDYCHCKCGATSVDGGRDYLRTGWDPAVGPGTPVELDVSDHPYAARLALAGTYNAFVDIWPSRLARFRRQYVALLASLNEVEAWLYENPTEVSK